VGFPTMQDDVDNSGSVPHGAHLGTCKMELQHHNDPLMCSAAVVIANAGHTYNMMQSARGL